MFSPTKTTLKLFYLLPLAQLSKVCCVLILMKEYHQVKLLRFWKLRKIIDFWFFIIFYLSYFIIFWDFFIVG